MNFQPVEDIDSVKLICEIYLNKPYTGTQREYGLLKMMLIKNKQGSTGVESAVCYILGLYQNTEKHGFDAMHPRASTLIELKPSTSISSPEATYNDLTIKKIKELEDTPNNKIIYAIHDEGKLVFMGMVSGKLFSQILKEKYLLKESKNFSEENVSKNTGDRKVYRQTHKVSLLSFIKKFGEKEVTVLFYVPNNKLQKNLVKALGLKNPVDNLNKFDTFLEGDQPVVLNFDTPAFDINSFYEV